MLYALRPSKLLHYFIALSLFFPFVPLSASEYQIKPCSEAQIREAHSRANDYREQGRLAPLKADYYLTNAARERAYSMAVVQNLSHDGWEQAVRRSGYGKSTVFGENIAMGFPTAAEVVNGWYASPGHHENLMKPAFRRSGIACVIGKRGRLWWVQIFGAEPKTR